MTKGRYFRAAEDAPCVPSATYLASREYTVNSLELPHGEWGGEQFYDTGVPPHLLPRNEPIGGDCLEHLRPTPGPDDAQAVNRGRCVHLATQELCGNVPLFANFSLAYETGIITYYRNVPNYLTKSEGEGEWSGVVPGLVDAVTRVRVTEAAGELAWRFAVGSISANTLVTTCTTVNPAWRLWDTTLSGIAVSGPFDFEDANRPHLLEYQSFCFWVDPDDSFTTRMSMFFVPGVVTVEIQNDGGSVLARWTSATFDGLSPMTLSLVFLNVAFLSAADATITVTPV